jgi:hypothetical protein
MSANLVINTNPYLKDQQKVVLDICRMVKTSSAVEEIYVNVHATLKKGGYQFSVTPQLSQKK